MAEFETAWTRTRILVEAKARARRVAGLLDWNIPGVEAAILNWILTEYEPEILADFIMQSLGGENDRTQEIPALPD